MWVRTMPGCAAFAVIGVPVSRLASSTVNSSTSSLDAAYEPSVVKQRSLCRLASSNLPVVYTLELRLMTRACGLFSNSSSRERGVGGV
jgi:hypothetical protein